MNKYQIRFLLDENTSHVIRDGLKRKQPEVEVRVIGSEGVPPLSTKDEDILKFLEREGVHSRFIKPKYDGYICVNTFKKADISLVFYYYVLVPLTNKLLIRLT